MSDHRTARSMFDTLRLINQAVPGNVTGPTTLRRVEILAEDYDRLRTERAEIERVLDRAGIGTAGSDRLSARVEELRLQRGRA